jgi:hypothetical protein
LKAVSLILQYRENAYRYLDDRSAYEVARLAVENMEIQLKPAGTRGRLPALTFKFLWSAAAFLVTLRVRKMNPDFLAPTVGDKGPNKRYQDTLGALDGIHNSVTEDRRNNRRAMHRLVPVVLSEAINFLNKTGGSPDIIVAISNAESDDHDDED